MYSESSYLLVNNSSGEYIKFYKELNHHLIINMQKEVEKQIMKYKVTWDKIEELLIKENNNVQFSEQ